MKKLFFGASLLAVAGMLGSAALAEGDDWSSLSKKKQSTPGLYMTAKQANDHMMANDKSSLFLDIREQGEVNYLGMPTVADANIPYEVMNRKKWNAKKHSYHMDVNPSFVQDVEARMGAKGLGKEDTVILMCRSGKRSARAASLLAKSGYTKVYSVVDGYEGDKAKEGPDKGRRVVNGWKNSGLPWTYVLEQDKMYGPPE